MRKCLQGKMNAGLVDKEKGQRALDLLDEIEKSLQEQMPKDVAASTASERLMQQLAHETAHKKKITLKTLQAQKNVIDTAMKHKGGFLKGIEDQISSNSSGTLNFQNLRESIRAQTYAQMHEGLKKFEPTLMGGKGKDFELNANDLIREGFGENTGNTMMKNLYKVWSENAEYLRQRFNNAGGDIPKLDNWRFPQSHDNRRILEAGRDTWKNFIKDKLDWDSMPDFETGMRMNELTKDLFLTDIYETLSTGGLNKINPSTARYGKGMLAKQRMDHRILKFKDAESWIAYSKEFGGDNPINAMISHIDGMSGDIARMEIFGPNPEGMKNLIDQTALKQSMESGKRPNLSPLNNLWDTMKGIESMSDALASFGSFTRGWLASSQLGSAFLSSLSDPATGAVVAGFNGMSWTKYIGKYAKMMYSRAERDVAAQMGFVADGAARVMQQAYLYSGQRFDTSLGQRLNRAVMKASLLEGWTQAGQYSFQMELSASLARVSQMPLSDMPVKLRNTIERYGITPNDWDLVRHSSIVEIKGAKYLSMTEVARNDIDVTKKFYNMFLTERDAAIIGSNLKTQAIIHQGTKRGTVAGELMRYLGMYKSFPVTFAQVHIGRMLREENFLSKASYGIAMFTSMTVLGMAAMQSKQIVRGKKPMEMNTKAWLAAATQGGGAGILGDYLFEEYNRFGNSLVAGVSGPSFAAAEDLYHFTIGNIREKINGDDTHIGSEAVRLLGRYIPGSSLWYTRLAYERLILDQMTYMADPRASKYFHNQERRARKEYKQDYWWRPGQVTPEAFK